MVTLQIVVGLANTFALCLGVRPLLKFVQGSRPLTPPNEADTQKPSTAVQGSGPSAPKRFVRGRRE